MSSTSVQVNTPVVNRIRELMPQFTESQKKLAKYILNHYHDVTYMTSIRLAEAGGVSEATVIRFVNKLGFHRYGAFQEKMSEPIREKVSQLNRHKMLEDKIRTESPMNIFEESLQADIVCIEDTLKDISYEDVKAVVEIIRKARRVYVVGAHAEYGMAVYFAMGLSWIKDNVYLIGEAHSLMHESLVSASQDDVMVAISFPPNPNLTIQTMKMAWIKRVTVISITNSETTAMSMYATKTLTVHTKQLAFAMNIAPAISLLSGILALISTEDYGYSEKKLNELSEYWGETALYFDDQNEGT